MDRLIAMKSFVEVASLQSFTKAALQLQLSRLQVSRHVQEVESWLQQRLLHRTTRQVSLTPAGQDALTYFQRILNDVCELEFSAQEQTNELSGCIRIAAPIGFSGNLLLSAVEKFTRLNTKIMIDIVASDNINELVEDRVDIALRFTEQPSETLIARKLFKLESVLCAAPSYLIKHGTPTHPNQLSDHNCFIHLNQNEWSFVEKQQSLKVKVSGNIKANSLDILVKTAVNGNGIVRVPCDLANPLIQAGQLTAILTNYSRWSFSLWAVYLSRSYQSPKVRSFIDFLVNEFQEDILLCEK
ncbi:MAG: LysR family transcriptional regulator [Psychromonas sp.]|nr:LysR family transcriptional regulator [Alteromonadales bacterium]MCP5077952.1 LysR family transcriptional regulator [Psychromonas sp.]